MNKSEGYLDPRDEKNWQELAKTYKHLREWKEDNHEEVETSKISFPSKERVDFLRSEEGLLALHSAWTVAVNQFSKLEAASFIDYRRWERMMTIAGLNAKHESLQLCGGISFNYRCLPEKIQGKACFTPEKLTESEREQVDAHERDPMNYNVDFHSVGFLTITFKIAIQGFDLDEQFKRVTSSSGMSTRLSEYVWDSLKNIMPWISPDTEHKQGEDTYIESFEDQFEGCSYKVEKVDSQKELIQICGLRFNQLFKHGGTLKPGPTHITSEGGSVKTIHTDVDTNIQGKSTNKVEKQLTNHLRAEGYLVVLEPDIFLPDPGLKRSRRKPDLLVLDGGKCIAVEIDDMSHILDAETGEFAWQRYQDDEDLRTSLMSKGIPMIRIWHKVVRDDPRRAVGLITQAFKNIWGIKNNWKI